MSFVLSMTDLSSLHEITTHSGRFGLNRYGVIDSKISELDSRSRRRHDPPARKWPRGLAGAPQPRGIGHDVAQEFVRAPVKFARLSNDIITVVWLVAGEAPRAADRSRTGRPECRHLPADPAEGTGRAQTLAARAEFGAFSLREG
jgi:hypothetical protein